MDIILHRREIKFDDKLYTPTEAFQIVDATEWRSQEVDVYLLLRGPWDYGQSYIDISPSKKEIVLISSKKIQYNE